MAADTGCGSVKHERQRRKVVFCTTKTGKLLIGRGAWNEAGM